MKIPLSSRSKFLAGWLVAVGFMSAFIAPDAHASLIANGGFEIPVVPPGGSGATPSPWVFPNPFAGGGSIIHSPVPGPQGPSYPSPQSGAQYEMLFSGGVIAQSFTVGAGEAGDYQLTWYDNALIRPSTDPRYETRYNVYVMAGSIPSVVDMINNIFPSIVATADIENLHGDATAWNARSLSMTLATGNYVLLFSNANGTSISSLGNEPFGAGVAGINDNEFALDLVSLDAVPVPEPSTMIAGVLLLLPFATSMVRVLRKRVGSWY